MLCTQMKQVNMLVNCGLRLLGFEPIDYATSSEISIRQIQNTGYCIV